MSKIENQWNGNGVGYLVATLPKDAEFLSANLFGSSTVNFVPDNRVSENREKMSSLDARWKTLRAAKIVIEVIRRNYLDNYRAAIRRPGAIKL